MDDIKLIPQVGRYSEPCSFLLLSSASTSCGASRHELFICCLSGEAIESTQEFPQLKWFLQFNVFPLWALSCMSESERSLAVLEMSTPTKEKQPAAGGCGGHLFVTSDPTSCSCPHPSAPPRPQPSPRSWHCSTNFLQHSSSASSPLSILKGMVHPFNLTLNIQTHVPQNYSDSNQTLFTSWWEDLVSHLFMFQEKVIASCSELQKCWSVDLVPFRQPDLLFPPVSCLDAKLR